MADGVDEPLSVADIFRREGLPVRRSIGSALVPRRRQRSPTSSPPEPAIARKAVVVTGSLLVVGTMLGPSAIDQAVVAPGLGSGPTTALADTPASAGIPAQRTAPTASTVDLAAMAGTGTPIPTVPGAWRAPAAGAVGGTAPATVATPDLHTAPVQPGPAAASPGSVTLPDVGVSGATLATDGGVRATLPAVTASPAQVALPPLSVAGATVGLPKVSTPPAQVPAMSLIGGPVKTVQSVAGTATGVLGSVVKGL